MADLPLYQARRVLFLGGPWQGQIRVCLLHQWDAAWGPNPIEVPLHDRRSPYWDPNPPLMTDVAIRSCHYRYTDHWGFDPMDPDVLLIYETDMAYVAEPD